MDYQLKRSIMLKHYENPKNRGLIDNNNYIKSRINNDNCIDELDLMIDVNNNIVKDIRFDGEACSICISSSSIMIGLLIGKTLVDVLDIIENFKKMVNKQDCDKTKLDDAIVYEDISKQPNRVTCALLPWLGVEKIMGESNGVRS